MRWSILVTVSIIVLHMAGWVLDRQGVAQVKVVRLLFDLRAEGNVASAFSALLWLVAALLMALLHVQERSSPSGRAEWGWLAGLFLFLACDEVAQVHEKLNKSMRALLGGGDQGILNYAWVIPYAVFMALVLGCCIRFLRAVDQRTSRGLLLAGAVFVAGAMGMELVESAHTHLPLDAPLVFVSTTVEETLEMTGVLLLIHTLLRHWQRHVDGMQVRCIP